MKTFATKGTTLFATFMATLALSTAFLLTPLAHATESAATNQAGNGEAASTSLSSGEVKKIDKAANKIILKHGVLTNLNMPAMTMVFRIKDPAMLEQVKVGDKVNFVAEEIKGSLVVTQIEALK